MPGRRTRRGALTSTSSPWRRDSGRTTHAFVKDSRYLASDAVSGSRSLVLDFARVDGPARAAEAGMPNPLGPRHEIPEVDRLGAQRVLVVSTPSARPAADGLAESLGDRLAARLDRPAVHTPVTVTPEAMQVVAASRADAVVSIGGGSAIGLAKRWRPGPGCRRWRYRRRTWAPRRHPSSARPRTA